jgi:hypothetical protein
MLPKMPKRELPGTFAQQSEEPVDWRVSGAKYIFKRHMHWVFRGAGCGFCFGILAWFLWPFLLMVPNYRLLLIPASISGLLSMLLKNMANPNEDVRHGCVLKKSIRLGSVVTMAICSFICGFGMGMLPIVLAFAVAAFA